MIMPITRRQFELGVDDTLVSWMTKIHGFLSENLQQAYTQGEIINALADDIEAFHREQRVAMGFPPDAVELKVGSPPVGEALEKLSELGVVSAQTIATGKYYAYRGDLPDLR